MDKTLSEMNFTDIYDKYLGKIYRFVFLKVDSREIAQDLASETFTRTFEYFKRNADKKIDNIQAFLFRTASNIVTDYYRQKSRTNVPLEFVTKTIADRAASAYERPDLSLMRGEQMSLIQSALHKMDSRHADVVVWHFIEDLSVTEIAEITGRPEGTIRVMLHRGLKELRNILSSHPS